MSKPSASTELARILAGTTRPLSPAEIIAATAPTVSKAAVYAQLTQGTSKGLYRRYGARGDYRYELANKAPGVAPQPTAEEPKQQQPKPERRGPLPEQLSPSIGLTCAHLRTLSEGERRLAVAVEACFRSKPEQTLVELVQALSGLGDRNAVKAALNEYAFAGRLTSRKDGSVTLYELADPSADRSDDSSRPEPAGDALSLARRLQAVSDDICQAIEDACDAALPHSVIKHLVTANRATHFARLDLQS